MKPNPCANWEICLLAAVLQAETNRGTYPEDWMTKIAWIYLNRVTLIKSQDTLWKAVKGNQSAAACYYQGCYLTDGTYVPPIYPDLPKNPTTDQLAEYWSNVYAKGSMGKYADGWKKSYAIAKAAYEDWQISGTGSTADPTSNLIPGGATDFQMVKPRDYKSRVKAFDSYKASREHFYYGTLGPEYILGLGQERYLFLSNLEYSNVLDIYLSQIP